MIMARTRVAKENVTDLSNGDVEVFVTFLTPVEAREYCDKAEGTINGWRRDGWLKPAGKLGKAYLYTKEDLDNALSLLGYDRKNIHVEVKDGK
jgi:hypothetical protein